MLFHPLFEVFEIPDRKTFILALLRNGVTEINTSYPEFVALAEALAHEHIILIANRLQLIGERPFSWALAPTVYGMRRAFELWCSKSERFGDLPLAERMTMVALADCDGIATLGGTVYLDTFEGHRREIEFDVSSTTLQSLAAKRLICLSADRDAWIACEKQPV